MRSILPSLILAAWLLPPVAFAADPAPAAAPEAQAGTVPAPARPDAADAQADDALIAEPMRLLQAGQADAALPLLDAAIAQFETRYAGSTRWYAAEDPAEGLAYMVRHAAEVDQGKASGAARLLPSLAWPRAWYMKGYALIEQGRFREAGVALERAVALSPLNATYLIELSVAHQKQQDWAAMLDAAVRAEEGIAFVPESIRAQGRARVWRGQGFALIELGRLDEAEAMFRRALEVDANDKMARDELEYIRQLRARQQP